MGSRRKCIIIFLFFKQTIDYNFGFFTSNLSDEKYRKTEKIESNVDYELKIGIKVHMNKLDLCVRF